MFHYSSNIPLAQINEFFDFVSPPRLKDSNSKQIQKTVSNRLAYIDKDFCASQELLSMTEEIDAASNRIDSLPSHFSSQQEAGYMWCSRLPQNDLKKVKQLPANERSSTSFICSSQHSRDPSNIKNGFVHHATASVRNSLHYPAKSAKLPAVSPSFSSRLFSTPCGFELPQSPVFSKQCEKIFSESINVSAGSPPALLKMSTEPEASYDLAYNDFQIKDTIVKQPTKESVIKHSNSCTEESSSDLSDKSIIIEKEQSSKKRGGGKVGRKRRRGYIYDPKPLVTKTKNTSIDSQLKDSQYWTKRQRNNEAAKKSRENRRLKELETISSAKEMTQQNTHLKERIKLLEERNTYLEKLLFRKSSIYPRLKTPSPISKSPTSF